MMILQEKEMKMKVRMIAGLLALMALAACGGSFPPEACLPIDPQVVHIGDRDAVQICFEDPDGEELVIQAVSSDEAVVIAVARARALTLEGVGIGEAVVTVTATDPGGQMAEVVVDVTVPNRPPSVDELPQVALSDETPSREVDLSPYFSDPDGHTLTYEVMSLNADVVAVAVEGSVVTFTRTGVGAGRVEVTVTDEGGLSVSALMAVSTSGRETVFRDEFEELSSNWQPDEDTDASIIDGRVRVRVINPGRLAYLQRRTQALSSWQVSMNIENITDDVWGGLVVETLDAAIDRVYFIFGADASAGLVAGETKKTNFVFIVRDRGTFLTAEGWFEFIDEIDGPGVAENLTITAENNSYVIQIDDEVAMTIRPAGQIDRLPMSMGGVVISALPAGASLNRAGGTLVDWIELNGRERTSPAVADLEVISPPFDMGLIWGVIK